MSLLRLLTAGKSLVGQNDTISRYQMGDPRAMPKFGSAKNPFRAAAAGPKAVAKGAELPAEGGTPELVPEAEVAADVRRRSSGIEVGECPPPHAGGYVEPREQQVAPEPKRTGPGLVGRWVGRVKSLVVRADKPKAAGTSGCEKLPVQGELSLETIKVIRNDLSDTDLEIVHSRQEPAKTSAAPAVETVQPVPATPSALGRVTSRMFGAGKS
jgi:hypothetical protein